MNKKAFPNYLELKPALPSWVWLFLRITSLGFTFFIVFLLFENPEMGLALLWKIMIPLLPISFLLIPGLWRNVCPMAFMNQIPRLTSTSLEKTLPTWSRNLALLLSIVLFVVLVVSRKPALNQSAVLTATMLIAALLLALVGGLIFKGRSGWCGTFCPLAPLQKLYGQAPLITVRNGYCDTCLGCQKNCYDFNPKAAVFSDLGDNDPIWADRRKYFAAILPGLIFGFFNSASPQSAGVLAYLASILTPVFIAAGLFQTLRSITQIGDYKLVVLFGLSALALFYWNGFPVFADGLHQVFGYTLSATTVQIAQFSVLAICVAALIRGLQAEKEFGRAEQASVSATVGNNVKVLRSAIKGSASTPKVKETSSGKTFEVRPEHSLLDAIEFAELPIMSGCRMGMCGSDPIVLTAGMDQLAPPDDNELTTLRRLGLEGKARLACCCKPKGAIEIDLEADPNSMVADSGALEQNHSVKDRSKTTFDVLIVGNGIAGISTAETLRQHNPELEIALIGNEPHHFYNRIGLEQVINGRTAMQGLYLLQDDWYQKNNIDVWLNTLVTDINRAQKQIVLGTGEQIEYKKLVLATGASAFIPPIPGSDLPGCFRLRSAADAVALRSWIQENQCKRAVVLGGGVLGVEAADALRLIGLKTTIINRSDRLMEAQIDTGAGTILKGFLENNGINIEIESEISEITGTARVEQVTLGDGDQIPADIVVFCVGVRANTELAKSAGIDVNRGVLVNQNMQTSDPDIFCVGDAAELPGALTGLWAIGSDHGKTAAAVILGDQPDINKDGVHPLQLKISGIDLKSFGRIQGDEETDIHTEDDSPENRWKLLAVKNNRIQGGVFVNSPMAANAAIMAMKTGLEMSEHARIESIFGKD